MEIVKVSEVDYAKGQIKVEMPAKDNIVSSWITFPNNEYEMQEQRLCQRHLLWQIF